jgi:flagellar basal-body rod protein FlgG
MEGMRAQLARQQVVARNLDNLDTPGFKQETGAIDGFASTLGRLDGRLTMGPLQSTSLVSVLGSLGVDTAIDRVSVDFRQGRLEETKQPLDVALAGDGFLQVNTPNGPLFFRGGPLHRDAEGTLVTSEGYQVLGADGQPLVVKGDEVSIAGNGDITVDGKAAGRLAVVEFAPGTTLAKMGQEFYTPDDPNAPPPAAAVATTVKQGFLEGSNVDWVSAMGDLVSIVRVYQANQRMLQAQDELLGKATNEVGRVA